MESIKAYIEANQNRPNRASARNEVPVRGNVYGEEVMLPVGKGSYTVADEGSYFTVRNGVLGTGIAGIAASVTFSDLTTLLYMRNGASDSDGTRCYLDYLKLILTVAGDGTTTQFYSWIDNIERYTSGPATVYTPVNENMDSAIASVCGTVKFGALVTTAASSNKRMVGSGSLRLGVKGVVADQYIFDFGGYSNRMPPFTTASTAIALVPWRHAPVVLGPGDCFGLNVYGTAQSTAMSFEFEFGWWER